MKIGIDARFWNETGVGRYIRNLIIYLNRVETSHKFVVFARSEDKEEIKSLVNEAMFSVVAADIPWHSLKEQLQLSRLIEREKIDLMHFPYFSVPLRYNRPFIITIHDLILHHFPTGQASTRSLPVYYAKHLGYKYIISTAAKKASRIITVSQATKEEIIDHLNVKEDKVAVIYEGVDRALKVNNNLEVNIEEKYFLHVGNVYPHKDPKLLVEAFSQIEDSSIYLYFVGKKDYFMSALEEYVKKRKIKNIAFKGFLSDTDLAMTYRGALATVVCSKMEGFGLPALEAMANRSLVIASKIPSLFEITQGNALFFEPGKTDQLKEQLESIAKAGKNKYASLMGKGEKIALQYSWEKMAEQTLREYERCNSLRQDK